jgi:hypothetical protein
LYGQITAENMRSRKRALFVRFFSVSASAIDISPTDRQFLKNDAAILTRVMNVSVRPSTF